MLSAVPVFFPFLKKRFLVALYIILVGKLEGMRPLGRRRCTWEDNIKIDLKGMRWEGVDWVHLVRCRGQWQAFASMELNLRVLQNVENLLAFVQGLSFRVEAG
jgi:hypothetical protein